MSVRARETALKSLLLLHEAVVNQAVKILSFLP